ncbi:MAG: type IV secretory system conjugative DNA transfer family protein, partial [Chloroflexota bacterium]|nr:type IV secretory system conjugative DNA transfer family protein [Chloroflexota bacterium]
VRICKGLWDQWGPRMQSILEHTVKTLHEVNDGPSVDRNGQYTILDGSRLLSEKEFRDDVLRKVRDPYILRWWAREFGKWPRHLEAEALAPVQTRLAYYSSSKRARAVLGQPRSTIDLRRLIAEGGVLFVSTAQGDVGRDVSALVGASLMNLLDGVIREQGSLPPERRRGVTVVVDEMQAMPGVDYESMLGELGKFGASLFLATQGLDKLDDLSPTLRGTLLSNVGCLAVFQVAAEDARLLAWELGKDRISEDDIISQRVHHCYVRATVGEERLTAFSMDVMAPERGRPEIASRVKAGTVDYTGSPEEMAAREAEAEKLVEQFRAELEARQDEDGEAPKQPKKALAPQQTKRRRRKKRLDPYSNGSANDGPTDSGSANEPGGGATLRSQME